MAHLEEQLASAGHATSAPPSFRTGPTRRVASRLTLTIAEPISSIPVFARRQVLQTGANCSCAPRIHGTTGPVALSSPCAAAPERTGSVRLRFGRGRWRSRTVSVASRSAARPVQLPACARTTSVMRHRSPATRGSRSASREGSSWGTPTSGHLCGGRCSRVTRRTRSSGSSRFEMRTNSVHPAAWRAPANRA